MPEGSIAGSSPLGVRTARLPRLPDQLEIKFGPIEALGRYILRADRALRDAGIRVSICTDFGEFLETNRRKRSRDWFSPLPCFSPEYCTLDERNAFWLKGVNQAGDTVMSHAIRLYVWPNTTMKDEVESLRVLYDVIPDAPNARGEASAPMAAKMSGRVGLMGALWLDPDYRGGKLAGIISPLTRAVALARWRPDFCASFVFMTGVRKGRAALYGWPAQNVEPSIIFWNLPGYEGPPLEGCLCYRTTAEVEEVVLADAGTARRDQDYVSLARPEAVAPIDGLGVAAE
jgi:hypothetical protein